MRTKACVLGTAFNLKSIVKFLNNLQFKDTRFWGCFAYKECLSINDSLYFFGFKKTFCDINVRWNWSCSICACETQTIP